MINYSFFLFPPENQAEGREGERFGTRLQISN